MDGGVTLTAQEVLEKLRVLGVALEVAGDRLRLSPPEAISPELLAAIRVHKPELLALLSRRAELSELSEKDELLQAEANMPPKGEPKPFRWSRLADSGLHHNDVTDHMEVIFLFAHELILDPTRAREDCQALSTMWAHYAPFWRERLPQEAFGELEQRYRQRLAALGQEESIPSQAPKALRPLVLNLEGRGCVSCGSADYWVARGGDRFCLACHPGYFKDAVAVGTIRAAEDSRLSDRQRRTTKPPARPLVAYTRPFWQRPDGSCFACGSRKAWQSIHGTVICAACHPPASPDLMEGRGGEVERLIEHHSQCPEDLQRAGASRRAVARGAEEVAAKVSSATGGLERSKIGWTDYSGGIANFAIGCNRISIGCVNCYGFSWARESNWNGGNFEEVTIYSRKLEQMTKAGFDPGNAPFRRGPGSRPMVFVVDLGDLFHEVVPTDFILQAFEVMASRPDVDFQVLTKRPKRMVEILGSEDLPAHIWVGVTAETQQTADKWISLLRQVNAAVRFVSVEPMLEPIALDLEGIDWVICGGESGESRRPFKKEWARDLRELCQRAGIPFLLKQGSHRHPGQDDLLDGQRIKEWPEGRLR